MTQKLITMTQKELSRYEVIKQLIAQQVNGTEAAKQTGLSVRHIKRLKVKMKKFGAQGIIHGNRGRESNRKIKPEIIRKAKKYLKKYYLDFGPTLAMEKLAERHNIKFSKETTRQIMIKEKLWKPKPRKKNKEYRSWRPRKEYFGEMEQFDGSYHDWFEGRNEKCCLLGSIDDATGKISKAKFVSDEGVIPVFNFWQRYVQKQGKPANIYLDRHSTYKQNQKSVFDDPGCLTQFERAMKDLNVNIIHAYSPQAKGRIERLFGTLQDRLIKELRLHNISTIMEANKLLEKVFISQFNEKFAVAPQKKRNLHRKLNKMEKESLDKIFSIQKERIINNDFTIRYGSQWYQLDKTQPTLVCRKDKVLIEKRLNGEIQISLRNKYLNFQQLPGRPKKAKPMKVTALTRTAPSWKPPADHPWRKQFIFGNKLIKVEKEVDIRQLISDARNI